MRKNRLAPALPVADLCQPATVLRALYSGNTATALGSLTAFIDEVNALILGGTLTVEAGQNLIEGASAMIDQIETSQEAHAMVASPSGV